MFGHVAVGGGFAGHHVRVELRRAAHGLAGVVDDEVQALAGGHQLLAEGLHAGRVAQVQSEHLQSVAPVFEVRLLRIACGGITRESRSDDQVRAGTQAPDTSVPIWPRFLKRKEAACKGRLFPVRQL